MVIVQREILKTSEQLKICNHLPPTRMRVEGINDYKNSIYKVTN